MKMRKVGRAFFVLSVAAGMTVALQGSASAASYTYRATDVSGGPDWNQLKACSYVNYNGEAGRACFQPNGDKFWVQDLKADGHHVEMNAQVNVNGNWYHCLNYHGKAAGWTSCSFATVVPENARIAYNVSVWEGDKLLRSGQLIAADT
ncbi:hypothetical protein AB0F32_05625 [Streptomyces albidoflavus]|uniref:Secreted protein n=2 Tax=Streptomyces TaxID=1883 RepID=A0ABY3H504_9ACTN|nr:MULTISPECIES: hypothetical protein [Streptomyces]MYQ74912.1 hypothetical protein [Streptomyces sp. SID4934]MYX85587.1 hypothetical protein [Streptomyces sp. SID4915]QLA56972.1 hypothetical protein HWN34_10605 [Streptomyces violascens]AGI88362.1 Hypothetical protein XNR_1984 [Streptomyces albidoflavus]MBT2879628.1 hypothetical protein [Streptomyces sp. McG6]